MSYIFSVDAESDGLYGSVWAIGVAVLNEDTREVVDKFTGQIDPSNLNDEWVRKNLVGLFDLPRYPNDLSLRNAFWEFWLKWREKAICVTDFGAPVEAWLFRQCVADDPETRTWLGPYPMHELGTALFLAEIDPDISRIEFSQLASATKHNPYDDALTAGYCWIKALQKIATNLKEAKTEAFLNKLLLKHYRESEPQRGWELANERELILGRIEDAVEKLVEIPWKDSYLERVLEAIINLAKQRDEAIAECTRITEIAKQIVGEEEAHQRGFHA